MKIISKMLGTIVSTFVNKQMAPKIDAVTNTMLDKAFTDRRISEEISEHILEKWGNEPFYNDLDSYITTNHLIENLIATVRGEANIHPTDQKEFAITNTHNFVNQHPKYCNRGVQQKQINNIFAWMFDFAFSKANRISPHTDSGKLQNEVRRADFASEQRDEQLHADMGILLQEFVSMYASITSGSLVACGDEAGLENSPVEIEAFTSEIKAIELNYQLNGQFEEAIIKYYELLQSISGRITGQNIKYVDALICTLNCNIALCQLNLDETDKAKNSLNTIPSKTADVSKIYHFVWASIPIQSRTIERYQDAKHHLDKALELDPQYHRAFLLRQYLFALMGTEDCSENIEILNNHFTTVLNENSDQKLISDFYINRGVIYLTYNDPFSASADFIKARELGCNNEILKLNLAASTYSQAVSTLPKGERVYYPNVDFKKIATIIEELKPIVMQTDIDAPRNRLVAEYAIDLYVSACSMVGINPGLTPISKYIHLVHNYETIRVLILSSQEDLSDVTYLLLDEDDRKFVKYQKMMENKEFGKCGEELAELYSKSPERMTTSLFHILLQSFLASKDSASYWEYRPLADSAGIHGCIIEVMDACAYELDGNIKQAKELFDTIASASADYQLLYNALGFFKRNGFEEECSSLYFRVLGLMETDAISIENPDSFYDDAIQYFISINSPSALEIIEKIKVQATPPENRNRILAMVYSKINDVAQLSTCLSQMYVNGDDFQDGFNLALCQKWLMHYDSSLEICFELLDDSLESENLVNLYWLISDLYLLKQCNDESCNWALKAHELMIQNPYDKSHQALFGRAIRCGHQEEGLAKILDYKSTHPVVVDWVKALCINNDENPVESISKQLEQFYPEAKSYDAQEEELLSVYRNQAVPINLILEHYHYDLGRFFYFAQKNKLRISMGNRDQLRKEENSIGQDIVVDAQTLIILSYYECLPALQSIPHIHINYGSIVFLQNIYLSFNSQCICKLLDWLVSADNIVFHPDGFVDDNSTFTTALSRNFVASCNISESSKIPLLYSDSFACACLDVPELSNYINTTLVSIPALCNHYGRAHPEAMEQMLYQLLTGCTFVSFSAMTIIEHIIDNDYNISIDSLSPFLICKSDYDMNSFASVYLQVIDYFKVSNYSSAIIFSEIIIEDTFRVWKRGSHYREMINQGNGSVAFQRSLAISRYVFQMANGVKSKLDKISGPLEKSCDELMQLALSAAKDALFPNILHD